MDSIPVVIDAGTGSTKAGFGGQALPSAVFPSVWPDQSSRPRCPIVSGVDVTDWNAIEALWRHAFSALGIDSRDHTVLVTEPPQSPASHGQKVRQILFETFDAAAVISLCDAALALRACGPRTSGVVLDLGFDRCRAVCICDSRPSLNVPVRAVPLGGNTLTKALATSVPPRCRDPAAVAEAAKREVCAVALDFQSLDGPGAPPSGLGRNFLDLPDGTSVAFGKERFRCPEALFTPRLAGVRGAGIHIAVHDLVCSAPQSIHRELWGNVALVGGTSMIAGVKERLEKELAVLAPRGQLVSVVAPPHRDIAAWLGGSSFAATPGFPSFCMTRDEYEESCTSDGR